MFLTDAVSPLINYCIIQCILQPRSAFIFPFIRSKCRSLYGVSGRPVGMLFSTLLPELESYRREKRCFCDRTRRRNALAASGISSRSFYARGIYPATVVRETKIQATGTTFSNFRDEVRPEGGHEKCSRFGTLTGVHQEAHIRSTRFRLDREEEQKNEMFLSRGKHAGRRRGSTVVLVVERLDKISALFVGSRPRWLPRWPPGLRRSIS